MNHIMLWLMLQAVKKAIANSYPMSVSLSSSGDLKIVEENWGMTGSSVTIKQYDINTLEEKSLVKISDVLELTDEESVTEVLSEDDGSVYVSVVNYDETFENWNTWKSKNKKGVDCKLSLSLLKNKSVTLSGFFSKYMS